MTGFKIPNILTNLFNKNKTAGLTSGLTAHHTHIQKKYFSLMLVPSYSYGTTRSIRISINTLYTLLFVTLAIVAAVMVLYVRSVFHRQTADYFFASLEEAQAVYENLQREFSSEQQQLLEGVNYLQSNIEDARAQSNESIQQQQLHYLINLENVRAYAEGLETRLRRYESYRQEIVDRLRESAHIPAVNNIINEIYESQMFLTSVMQEIYDFTSASQSYTNWFADGSSVNRGSIMMLGHTRGVSSEMSVYDAESELIHYISMLGLALEAQDELFVRLEQQVRTAAPLIRRDRYGPRLLEWSYMRSNLPLNTPIMITDVRTGLTYWVKCFSRGNHADVFPVSAEDTEIMLRTFGGRWSWNTRPIWVHYNGRKVAASINGMPHGGTSNRNNNMAGHICIHFRGSRTHSGSATHERDHQNSVTEAYRANF